MDSRSRIRSLTLLLFLSPAWGADYAVLVTEETIDGDTFCGGVCQPGDRLILDGGTHTLNEIRDLDGCAGADIQIINDATDSSSATINLDTGGLDAFALRHLECVILEGVAWVGAPAGQCGVADDGTEGRTQCGIRFVYVSAEPTHLVRVSGSTKNFTMRGFEIDGDGFPRTGIGTGLMINDHFYAAPCGNDQGEATWDICEWRENYLIENYYIHRTFHSGIYAGPNFGKTATIDDLPLRNFEFRNGLVEDIGWNCMQLKTSVDGTNLFENIHTNNCGFEAADDPDVGHSTCVNTNDVDNMTFNRVQVSNCGGPGIVYRNLSFHDNAAGLDSIFDVTITNSRVADAAVVLSGQYGIHIHRKKPSVPDIDALVGWNTIVNSRRGINVFPDGGSTIFDVDMIENIACDNNVFDIDSGEFTPVNNVTGACSAVNFVNYSARDLHLTAASTSAVDQGTEAGAPAEDCDSVSRPQGSANDIGACEFNQGPGNPNVPLQAPKPDPHVIDAAEIDYPDHLWVFNEESGSTVEDDGSATDCDLTISGAAWSSSVFGPILTFVSSESDSASNGACTSPVSGTATVCVIARIASAPGSRQSVISMGDASDADQGTSLKVEATSGNPRSVVVHTGGGSFDNNDGTPSISDNNFNLICQRMSDTINDLSVNGSDWDASAWTGSGLYTGIDTIGVGARFRSTTDQYFDGDVIAKWIWNVSKTAAEIDTVWNDGDPWANLGVDPASGPPPVLQRGQSAYVGGVSQ